MQGVGFRYFTKEQAKRNGLVGYVRNLPNGDVEIDAAGDAKNIDDFVYAVKRGPRASRVVQVVDHIMPVENLSGSFEIQYF